MIEKYFKRRIEDEEYEQRLAEELELIRALKFESYFLRVVQILELVPDIPHIVRGSGGSSLVCYYLGISDIDPIKEKIGLARFLNHFRTDMPDIDLDFPWYSHETVLQRVYKHWGRQVARVCTHVRFRRKSALREALRQLGPQASQEEIIKTAQGLLGENYYTSKHPGGVVILDEPIPDALLSEPHLLNLDKDEVEERGWYKIDLLSNRGLGQLMNLSQRPIPDYPEYDEATSALLQRGDVLGITQGESPAFRQLAKAIKPRCRQDVILATALIRPAATKGRRFEFLQRWAKVRSQGDEDIIFEDDAIDIIVRLLGCTQAEGDRYRRAFAKSDEAVMAEFADRVGSVDKQRLFEGLTEYSFCKSHAVSYGRMIWALAYQKAHRPKAFWLSTLNNCLSMYRPWVHVHEAVRAGWKIAFGSGPWHDDGGVLRSLHAPDQLIALDDAQQMRKAGYWVGSQFLEGMYLTQRGRDCRFKGLIATYRHFYKGTFITIGYASGMYIELVFDTFLYEFGTWIEGQGYVEERYGDDYINVVSSRMGII